MDEIQTILVFIIGMVVLISFMLIVYLSYYLFKKGKDKNKDNRKWADPIFHD